MVRFAVQVLAYYDTGIILKHEETLFSLANENPKKSRQVIEKMAKAFSIGTQEAIDKGGYFMDMKVNGDEE